MTIEKAANLYDWIISRIHMDFTVMADHLYGDGVLTQDERKALSAAIGDALDAYNAFAGENLSQLRQRRPYQEANESMLVMPEAKAIKMLGRNRIGGYMAMWGDESAKDLDGEWFTPETEEMTTIFKAVGRLPWLYNHATDDTIKSTPVGIIDVMETDDVGLWYEAQLDTGNKYIQAVRNLINKRALGTSSGTLPGARKVAKSGQILRWPIVEGSGTTTPADPRQRTERPIAEIKTAFSAIGAELPDPELDKGAEEARQAEITKALRLLALVEFESTIIGV